VCTTSLILGLAFGSFFKVANSQIGNFFSFLSSVATIQFAVYQLPVDHFFKLQKYELY
jgi:hypothetical protein